jgi:PAS domain S-box-containing protein
VIRVLIIDTDHAHARSVEEIVRRHLGDGVRTTVATSTAGAIPLIEAGEFDVALVDSGAHDTRGLELIQRGLVLHPRRAFIFMTASQDGGLPLLALQAGAVDVLDKTDLTTDTLLRSLRHAVHRSTARSTLVEACDRFRTHFMNSGVAAWQSSVDGRLIDVNPAAAVMLGYESIAQLLAVNTAALHVEQEEHRAFGLELERNGRVTNQERRLKRRDGSVIWLDVLVTDVMMPNMSGPQLARTLRELRPELKVLFMSGYTANAIVDQGLLQPGAPFLSKPFSPSSLALAVRSLLDGHPDNEIPERSGPGNPSGRSRPRRQVKELETPTGH